MSAEALPITPARFAEAIKDLSLASLHLKVLELRNSIAHLDYSNEQLKPYAEGTAASFDQPQQPQSGSQPPQPDQDCIDAIKENEIVIARMLERIALVREEVERRGCSWTEFEAPPTQSSDGDETAAAEEPALAVNGDQPAGSNAAATGNSGSGAQAAGRPVDTSGLSEAWRDGTIQMGVIRNGQLHMDNAPPASSSATAAAPTATTTTVTPRPGGGGGTLSDEQLRRALEERMRLSEQDDDDNDADGGLHL